MMARKKQLPTSFLADIAHFSRGALRLPLYDYQLQPLYSIIDSIRKRCGREYLLLFSRQSGKNEAMAHLLVYMLNLLRRKGGNMVFAATGNGLGRGVRRLEERLNNPFNHRDWRKAAFPMSRVLGEAAVVFISSHPQSAARGETADHLLIVDEMQDQQRAHIEAVFTPMRAARNATAVYLGTARTRHDALWLKKVELERQAEIDGLRRVFTAGPQQIIAANPAYRNFLQEQVQRHGRYHPIIASEYYLEPLGSAAGLFPPRRLALMRGDHARRRSPSGAPVIALLDVGGQDEAATSPIAQLENPARDYSACTIVELIQPGGDGGPIYHALDIFTDHGSRHFQSYAGRPSLAERLLAYLHHWRVDHLVCDATGVGEGLSSWLAGRLGASNVTPFKFSASSKAALGASFLALVETGRFKYWSDDADEEYSDGHWFWTQAAHCAYDLPPGARFEQDLRWYVPTSARVSTPSGMQSVHDDRLISASLVAEADRLLLLGKISLGQAVSVVIRPSDPLDLSW
jgi:hypothetical protein